MPCLKIKIRLSAQPAACRAYIFLPTSISLFLFLLFFGELVIYNWRRHEIPRYTGIAVFLWPYIIDGEFLILRITRRPKSADILEMKRLQSVQPPQLFQRRDHVANSTQRSPVSGESLPCRCLCVEMYPRCCFSHIDPTRRPNWLHTSADCFTLFLSAN